MKIIRPSQIEYQWLAVGSIMFQFICLLAGFLDDGYVFFLFNLGFMALALSFLWLSGRRK